MANNLIIVESPTKSKTITKFLPKSYTVMASMGHLRDLPKSSFGVDVEHGFEPKYINIRGKGPLIKDLKNKAKKADKVYLATDPDREGEAIGWHLAHILELDPKKACRIEFHEITNEAVKGALKSPRTLDLDMVDAQQTRRIIDRIVGYKLSPLLWRKIRKGLSAGRVQSVAVKIIADREKEIEAFVPEEFWTINVKLKEAVKKPAFEAEVVKHKNEKLKLSNVKETMEVEQYLAKAEYKVESAVRKDVNRRPQPPFTTSSLQQEAGKKLSFTTKRTMMLAQQLYEGVNVGKEGSVGLITYMRTDSVRLADSAKASIREFITGAYGKEYCPAKPNFYSTKQNAQDAHEAIRPTSVLRTPVQLEPYLNKDQLKLYRLIWNRAVASQMPNAVYENTTLQISAGEYGLRASGSILKFDGYQRLSDAKDLAAEKSKAVPFIEAGSDLVLNKVEPGVQHFTEPPAHYTEASLVKELEEKGIGRPSTYSPIIQTILDRGYVAKEGKKLLATELGLMVVDMLTTYFKDIINIPFSAKLETELDEIAEHKAGMKPTLEKFYSPFSKLLEKADKEIEQVELPVIESDVVCDKCGRKMVYKEGRFGKFLACPGFPECRNTKPILQHVGVPCPICGNDTIVRKTRTGRIFYGCEKFPECNFTSWDKPSVEKCPVCGKGMVEHPEKGGTVKLYCSDAGCVNAVPKRAPKPKKVTTATVEEKPAALKKLLKVKKVVTGAGAKKAAAKAATSKAAVKKSTKATGTKKTAGTKATGTKAAGTKTTKAASTGAAKKTTKTTKTTAKKEASK